MGNVVVCPSLIDRVEELRELTSIADSVATGRGATVLLTGDAGIGKTRLCHALRHALSGRMRIIEGRCSPTEHSVAYAPFMNALRFRLARGESIEATKALGPLVGPLASLFPELGAGEDGSALQRGDVPPEKVFELVTEVVRRLAGTGGLVLILEDFQWADPTSRDLLHHLARSIHDSAAMLVVTARTDELHIGHPVRRLFATLERERVARSFTLAPLDREAVRAMLTELMGGNATAEMADVVWRRTEGNPLFVEELMKTALGDPSGNGLVSPSSLAETQLPASISEAILSRIESLGDDGRDVLSVAAVIGREFDFELLRTATRIPEEELMTIVERLVARHVLIDAGGIDEERYAFRHGLLREVIYQSSIARRRRAWHRSVAEALERAPRTRKHLPHQALAYHYRLGGDSLKATEHAKRAGDEAARLSAWADAELHYQDALASLENDELAQVHEADLLERLSSVVLWRGKLDESREYAERALTLRRDSGDRVRSAALLRRLALLHAHQRGDWTRAESCLREALVLLGDDGDRHEATLAMIDLGRLCLFRGNLADAERWLEQGLTLASASHTVGEEALALALLGMLAVIRADVRAGIARLDLALALLEDQEVALDRVTVVFSAGIRALEKAREYDRAIKWIDAGITHASRHGAYADSAIFRAHRAAVERELGRLDSAHTLALQAVNDLRDANRAELREALVILGDICRVRGDTAGAREAYQEARDLGDPFADVGEALVVLAENRPAEAAHALAAALEQRPPGHHLLALRVLPPLIEALVRSENLPAATIALRRLQAEVERSDYRVGTQAQLYADGLVTSLAGDVSSARRALELSAEGWKAAGFPFEHARALAALSSILIAHGLTDDGVRVAREALDIFEEIGAEGESERLRRMLRKVGVRHRSVRQEQADATPFGLTARELQVLTHMSRGSTNRQIAAELGISEKTVSIHVSHVLAKLHCATRTQAARIAMDNGLS